MLTSNAYTGALNERISEGDERNELRLYMRWKAALYNYSNATRRISHATNTIEWVKLIKCLMITSVTFKFVWLSLDRQTLPIVRLTRIKRVKIASRTGVNLLLFSSSHFVIGSFTSKNSDNFFFEKRVKSTAIFSSSTKTTS